MRRLLNPPQAFPVGPKFKGLKMLPPGPHFVGYNAGNKHNEYSPTTAFFIVCQSGSVDVRAWDKQAELLRPLNDAEQVRRVSRRERKRERKRERERAGGREGVREGGREGASQRCPSSVPDA